MYTTRMAVRPTTQIGYPALKAINVEITDVSDPKVQQVITDLVESMRATELIGMAAPQIGENFQIFVTEPRETKARSADQSDQLRVYINPKIIETSKEQVVIYEGCGSVLHGAIFGPVQRPKQITVEAHDEDGKKFQLTCDGILARVIQHEVDHLNCIEFMEKVSDYKKLLTAEYYIERIKNDPKHIESCRMSKIEVK